jgi:hypothetical protein
MTVVIDPGKQALYDALNCAAQAVLAVEGWDHRQAETALLEASWAAADAYPPGSPQSETLGGVLALVADLVNVVPL